MRRTVIGIPRQDTAKRRKSWNWSWHLLPSPEEPDIRGRTSACVRRGESGYRCTHDGTARPYDRWGIVPSSTSGQEIWPPSRHRASLRLIAGLSPPFQSNSARGQRSLFLACEPDARLHVPFSVTILSTERFQKCSDSADAGSREMSGAVTRSMGVCRQSNACSAITAEISAPIPRVARS